MVSPRGVYIGSWGHREPLRTFRSGLSFSPLFTSVYVSHSAPPSFLLLPSTCSSDVCDTSSKPGQEVSRNSRLGQVLGPGPGGSVSLLEEGRILSFSLCLTSLPGTWSSPALRLGLTPLALLVSRHHWLSWSSGLWTWTRIYITGSLAWKQETMKLSLHNYMSQFLMIHTHIHTPYWFYFFG